MTGIGHNSNFVQAESLEDENPRVAAGQLKAIVSRIERLEEEKKTLQADIKEVYAEAKTSGFDTKILRKAIAFRKQDKHAREEQQAMLDVYLEALGDLASTPLGKSALEHASA